MQPDNNQIIKVAANEVFSYNVKLTGKVASISITKGNVTISEVRELKSAFILTRVSLWFGGNRTAPNKIEVFIKR